LLQDPRSAHTGAGLRGAEIEIPDSSVWAEIGTLEDARSDGEGRLVELLGDADARVRERSALALGRLPLPEHGAAVTAPLCQALQDPVPAVRCAVAFALGQRADPTSASVLAAWVHDPDVRFRARVVEAASKIDDAALRALVLTALNDVDLAVRCEAALGAACWSASDSADVDRALRDALAPMGRIDATPKELAWRLLFALARRRSELGRSVFVASTACEDPLARIFALQGLGSLPPDEEGRAAAASSLARARDGAGRDWRVAYEACVALGRMARAALDPAVRGDPTPLLEAGEDASAHVRAAAMEALGGFAESDAALSGLRRGLLDVSPSVGAAALASLVGLVDRDDALERIERFAEDEDPVARAGAAEAAARVDDPRCVPLLRRLTQDANLRVATAAVEALASQSDPLAGALVRELATSSDNGIRLSAILALRERAVPEDVSLLEEVLRTTSGDIATEVAFTTLESLEKLGGERARAVIEAALGDPRPHVRRVARRALERTWSVVHAAAATEPVAAALPLPGRDYPLYTENPLVELRTHRGSMIFELFPLEAPVHVHSFLELARRGSYDGLTFHRVVPDFVVQGGDYRGDGNGGRPWRGEALRAEFTPRKYVRGSLGMPRNDDVDSGGSQFFVTHRPTPHLDGRYTIFGELRSGGDVLDRIEIGDRILSIERLP
jgi:cyclophilin family peptidyl-prolyl cis-trans isomerase/HEAT repeat protein